MGIFGNLNLLHITDTHVTGAGVTHLRDDHKDRIEGLSQPTREGVLEMLLARIAEQLTQEEKTLDAIIFSGDAIQKGAVDGHRALFDLLIKHFSTHGISPDRIVATPGNHDVPIGSPPGSEERYKPFLDVWRLEGCKTPWIDGIDRLPVANPDIHRLFGPSLEWAIYPINSANWSHAAAILDPPLSEMWKDLHNAIPESDAKRRGELRKQLDALARYDMARVSEDQMEAFRSIVASTPQPPSARQLRLATLHHHLRAPSLREEVKAFADFTNLEHLRQALREQDVSVVLHGHKHEHRAQLEHVYAPDSDTAHRMLILSGATFDPGHEQDAARSLVVDGLPFAPEITITPLAIPRGGLGLKSGRPLPFRLWENAPLDGEPIIVQGTDIDVVYERARCLAAGEAAGGTLIVHLDLDNDRPIALPQGYPLPNGTEEADRQKWLEDLANWWQIPASQLQRRIPHIHGARLRNYAGYIDQVERVKAILARKGSSRAVAVLVDPVRDFRKGGANETFASFLLVQFRKRETAGSRTAIDVVGYYRAQEFARWWPINVAELRLLQVAVCRGRMVPGRITTLTADARSIGRSPTQVAMPLIDRWIDQNPALIHLLANAVIGQRCGSEEEGEAIKGWFKTLAELEEATQNFNPDGVPLAIEGIRRLSAYLDASDKANRLHRLREALNSLANANEAYERTAQSEVDFNSWGAGPHVRVLRDESERVLGGRQPTWRQGLRSWWGGT